MGRELLGKARMITAQPDQHVSDQPDPTPIAA